jgi:hypothetical protein
LTRGDTAWKSAVNLFQFDFAQVDIERLYVLLKTAAVSSAGDGNNVIALGEDPGKRKLRRGAVLLTRNLFNFLNEINILLEVISLKSSNAAAEVIGREIFETLDLSGKKAAAKRTVGNKPNAQFAACGQNFIFGITGP